MAAQGNLVALPGYSAQPSSASYPMLTPPARIDPRTLPADARALVAAHRGRPLSRDGLEAVSRLVQARPYLVRVRPGGSDVPVHAPARYLAAGGNCADAAHAAYALIRAIAPDARLWLASVPPGLSSLFGHAVVLVEVAGELMVVDSIKGAKVWPLRLLPEYAPRFTANEAGRWEHRRIAASAPIAASTTTGGLKLTF